MAGLLADLGAYLVTNGLGTLGTDIHLGILRDSPDVATGLFELPGGLSLDTMESTGRPSIITPRLQVLTRAASEDYEASKARADAVWDLLTRVVNQTINGTYYVRIEATDTPAPLDRDDDKRVLFVANYRVHRAVA